MTTDYAEIRSPALVFKELADRATASADPYPRARVHRTCR